LSYHKSLCGCVGSRRRQKGANRGLFRGGNAAVPRRGCKKASLRRRYFPSGLCAVQRNGVTCLLSSQAAHAEMRLRFAIKSPYLEVVRWVRTVVGSSVCIRYVLASHTRHRPSSARSACLAKPATRLNGGRALLSRRIRSLLPRTTGSVVGGEPLAPDAWTSSVARTAKYTNKSTGGIRREVCVVLAILLSWGRHGHRGYSSYHHPFQTASGLWTPSSVSHGHASTFPHGGGCEGSTRENHGEGRWRGQPEASSTTPETLVHSQDSAGPNRGDSDGLIHSRAILAD